MNTSKNGQDMMHYFESCELEAYPDPASPLGKACTSRHLMMRAYRAVAGWEEMSGDPWTIGWGNTGPEVVPGLAWTQGQCDVEYAKDLDQFESDVESLVKVPLTQGQFDALVSFAYNVGSDIDQDKLAEGLGDSTLLKMLNAGQYAAAADEFLKWNKAGGQAMLGLKRRRAAERAVFLDQDWRQAIQEVS